MSPKFIREGFDLCQCARDLVFREAGVNQKQDADSTESASNVWLIRKRDPKVLWVCIPTSARTAAFALRSVAACRVPFPSRR